MKKKKRNVLRQSLTVFRYSGRAVNLVWTTSRSLTILLAILTLVAGLLPAAISYIGKLIVDAVVSASLVNSNSNGFVNNYAPLLYVGLEAIAIILLAGSQRGIIICQSLLRALLGQRVNVLILEKALTLDLRQFEDSEFYDKLTNARREASVRPLSLVTRTFGLVQNALSLFTYGILLVNFSVWAVVMLIVAAMPVFIAETTEAGRFPPNAFGLYDMHGNVWEWCQDNWHDSYKGAPTNGSAWIDEINNQLRVLRGGSWDFTSVSPVYCRSAIRSKKTSDYDCDNIGFRVVMG